MRWVLVLAMLVGCRGDKPAPAPPPAPPTPVPVPSPPAPEPPRDKEVTQALECLTQRDNARVVTMTLESGAPVPLLERAAQAAVARSRADGETAVSRQLADAIHAYAELDALGPMRAAFAELDTLKVRVQLQSYDVDYRVRVGLPLPPDDQGNKLAMIRETALAGDVSRAAALFVALVTPADLDDNYEQELYLGALVALGRRADARALIAKQPPEDRLHLIGTWLDVALRMKPPVTDAVAMAVAELAIAPDRGVTFFGVQKQFRLARAKGRGAELVPLYKALKARQWRDVAHRGGAALTMYDLALLLGDTTEQKALEAEPEMAATVLQRTGPLDRALTATLAEKYPDSDLARLWVRYAQGEGPTAFGGPLIKAACAGLKPPPGPSTPALPGLHITTKVVSRGMKMDCALDDLVVRLTNGERTLGEQTLEAECHGACTKAEVRAGERELARLEKAIERGEASESETDYNFTSCIFTGSREERIDEVGVREVALLAHHFIGPHDVDHDEYQLALEVCGKLFVSSTFAHTYGPAWQADELTIRESPDHTQIIVDGKRDQMTGVLFRLRLPACPGTPDEEVLEPE